MEQQVSFRFILFHIIRLNYQQCTIQYNQSTNSALPATQHYSLKKYSINHCNCFQLQQQNRLKKLLLSSYFFLRLFFYPLLSARSFLPDLSESWGLLLCLAENCRGLISSSLVSFIFMLYKVNIGLFSMALLSLIEEDETEESSMPMLLADFLQRCSLTRQSTIQFYCYTPLISAIGSILIYKSKCSLTKFRQSSSLNSCFCLSIIDSPPFYSCSHAAIACSKASSSISSKKLELFIKLHKVTCTPESITKLLIFSANSFRSCFFSIPRLSVIYTLRGEEQTIFLRVCSLCALLREQAVYILVRSAKMMTRSASW